ncbi:helix-turn-helix domain-containing protein [Metapseudomonas sp. CR1201]
MRSDGRHCFPLPATPGPATHPERHDWRRWNVSAAARELGMSRPTLYRWMKLHHIVRGDSRRGGMSHPETTSALKHG